MFPRAGSFTKKSLIKGIMQFCSDDFCFDRVAVAVALSEVLGGGDGDVREHSGEVAGQAEVGAGRPGQRVSEANKM